MQEDGEVTTAGVHTKTGTTTKAASATATSQTAAPLSSAASSSGAWSRPRNVSSSYGFCSRRVQEKKKKKSPQMNDREPPGGRGCSAQPVMMSRNKHRAPDALRMLSAARCARECLQQDGSDTHTSRTRLNTVIVLLTVLMITSEQPYSSSHSYGYGSIPSMHRWRH